MKPFYFAWVEDTETTFNVSHLRNDESLLDFRIDGAEGDFATLAIEIVNPRVGLLAPGRKLWAWFSMHDPAAASESESESESEGASAAVPLFFGRVVGLPEDSDNETIRLVFVARPKDFEAQKFAVAAGLKVAPYWDPIWFSPEDAGNPDNALESRPERWHIDRVTHEVTSSNIVNGEDGTLIFDETNVFADSVHISYGQTPLRQINVSAQVSWAQMAAGRVEISDMLGHGMPWQIATYTGDMLLENWPKPGASIGGGWKIGAGTKISGIPNVARWDYNDALLGAADGVHDLIVPEWATAQTILFTNFPAHVFHVPLQLYRQTTTIEFDTNRSRSETVAFTLEADVQAIVTDPGEDDVLNLSFSSSEISSPVDPGGAMPIGSVAQSTFFSRERGTQSIEYLIALARAQLIARSRCVEVTLETPFSAAMAASLSLRKNGLLYDSQLPGGVAAGKITAYSISGNGDSGVFACDVTIECTIGKGGTVSAIPGTPTYAEDGYASDGYQFREDAFVMPIAGEVAYSSIEGLPPNDDGLDFSRMSAGRIVKSVTKTGFREEQEAAMGISAHEPNDVFTRLNAVPAKWRLELVPVTGGPFQTDFGLSTTLLKIPKTIDLEATP